MNDICGNEFGFHAAGDLFVATARLNLLAVGNAHGSNQKHFATLRVSNIESDPYRVAWSFRICVPVALPPAI
jgi:hypothetical protein